MPRDARGAGRGATRLVTMALLAAAGLWGCGDGGGERPAALELVSPERDTVEAGAALEPPLQVRVTDGRGSPVAGVDVRFAVTVGPGEISDPRVETGTDGRASTVYRNAERVGIARVEADLPGAPDVGKVAVSIRVLPPTRTEIRSIGGDGQEAETGSQLPRRLEVEVLSPSGTPVGGTPVAWRVVGSPSAGGGSGGLVVDTTYSDGDGRAWNLLTLGEATGEYRVSALSEGAEEPAIFTATAVESLPGDVVLDSVAPRPLRAGEEAIAYGSGLPTSAADAGVRVEGVGAEVLSASSGSLRFRVPEFADRCLPARPVGVRVESDDLLSEGLLVELRPAGEILSLEVGESVTTSPPTDPGCIQLDSAAAGRTYRVVAQSASMVSGATTPMRLVVRSGADVGASAADPAATPVAPRQVPYWRVGPEDRGLHLRTRLEQAAREELLGRPGGKGGERPPPSARRPPSAAATVPATGDTLEFVVPVGPNLTVSCTDTSTVVSAVVREVGERVALVEDTLSPADGFTDGDWEELAREMDEVIFPTDTAYFGPPADINGDGRVLVLFTPEVNRLTPAGSEAFVGGFFLSTDLVDSGDEEGGGVRGPEGEICPASNESELVYLAVADPRGNFGIEVSRDRAIRNARSVSAHEIEHLLSAQQRMIHRDGWVDDLESAWLGEALAHVAEEAAGLAVRDLATRENLDHARVTADEEAYEAFFLNNLARGAFFLQEPGNTLTIVSRDPGGVESLKMRGFGWLLARWLGDHFGPDGSGGPVEGSREEALFRELSSGGPDAARGIDNVLRALAAVDGSVPSWAGLLTDFGTTLAVDDDADGLRDRLTLPTWDLRDVYRGIHEGPRGGSEPFTEAYPLQNVTSGASTAAFVFDVNASGGVYFEIGEGSSTPALSLALRSQGGDEVPPGAGARFTVIRVR